MNGIVTQLPPEVGLEWSAGLRESKLLPVIIPKVPGCFEPSRATSAKPQAGATLCGALCDLDGLGKGIEVVVLDSAPVEGIDSGKGFGFGVARGGRRWSNAGAYRQLAGTGRNGRRCGHGRQRHAASIRENTRKSPGPAREDGPSASRRWDRQVRELGRQSVRASLRKSRVSMGVVVLMDSERMSRQTCTNGWRVWRMEPESSWLKS